MPDASTILIDSAAARGAAVVAVVRAAARLRREHEALCQAHGLSGQQFNVLRILRGAERAAENALPTMTVGERMIEPEPGVTRLMGRLEAKGLVQRVRCALTPAGHAALAALDGPLDALHAVSLDGLSDADVATLVALLVRALPDPVPSSLSPSCPT